MRLEVAAAVDHVAGRVFPGIRDDQQEPVRQPRGRAVGRRGRSAAEARGDRPPPGNSKCEKAASGSLMWRGKAAGESEAGLLIIHHEQARPAQTLVGQCGKPSFRTSGFHYLRISRGAEGRR